MTNQVSEKRKVYIVVIAPANFYDRCLANSCREVCRTYDTRDVEWVMRVIPKGYQRFLIIEEEEIK